MYDGKTQLLIQNPINRYLINSPMLPSPKKNADGSLTLYRPEGLAGQGEGSELAARAIVAWVFARKRKARFERNAEIPFQDKDG